MGVTRTQIPIDAGYDEDQKRCGEHQADERALDMQPGEIAAMLTRQEEDVPVKGGEPDEAAAGDDDQGPGRPRIKQHRRQRDLQEIERDKGIGRAAGEVKLDRQGRDIEQQCEEQLGVADDVAVTVPEQAHNVEPNEECDDDCQLSERQCDLEPEMDDKDRHHLPDDGKPAKLDQEKQVLLVGYVVNGNRPVPLFDQACTECLPATKKYTYLDGKSGGSSSAVAASLFEIRRNSTNPAKPPFLKRDVK